MSRGLAVSLCLVLAAGASGALAADDALEPEYVGIPHRLGTQDGKPVLQPLERQTYSMFTKTKAMGFGGSKASYQVPGTRSPVRFPAGEPMKFVMRMASQGADPSAVFRLVKLQAADATKKQAKAGAEGFREMVVMDQRGMMGDVNLDPTMGALPILAKPYGTSSLEFRAEADLSPGEYAVVMTSSMTAFCFGVDAAPAK